MARSIDLKRIPLQPTQRSSVALNLEICQSWHTCIVHRATNQSVQIVQQSLFSLMNVLAQVGSPARAVQIVVAKLHVLMIMRLEQGVWWE